jgi:hypothetical protein
MARAGEDVRLAEMLLEVALDLEAEAEAIEAEQRDARPMPLEPVKARSAWPWRLHSSVRDLTASASAPAAERVS